MKATEAREEATKKNSHRTNIEFATAIQSIKAAVEKGNFRVDLSSNLLPDTAQKLREEGYTVRLVTRYEQREECLVYEISW